MRVYAIVPYASSADNDANGNMMEENMSEKVLILGANGRFGRLAARAFADAGWYVFAQARKTLVDAPNARIRHLGAAVTDLAEVTAAARGASIVVHAMNPLYTNWETEALPLNAAAIDIARTLDATLMLPGNVYNFGAAMPPELTEATPQRPTNRKGEIRCQMEAAIRAGAPHSIVVRAGDFFGGPGAGSWMDQAILKDLAKGRITYPGPRDIEHAWAFLPDLARTFVLLAEARGRLAPHETFHFPGHTLTGEKLVAGITGAARRGGVLPAGGQPRVTGLPWALVRVAGIVNPMLRELAKMSYLWRTPHRLSGAKLKTAIGTIPFTPLDGALDATLSELRIPALRG
jgi:nucleoside-diphosphate-sugar epimerase